MAYRVSSNTAKDMPFYVKIYCKHKVFLQRAIVKLNNKKHFNSLTPTRKSLSDRVFQKITVKVLKFSTKIH